MHSPSPDITITSWGLLCETILSQGAFVIVVTVVTFVMFQFVLLLLKCRLLCVVVVKGIFFLSFEIRFFVHVSRCCNFAV